MSIKIFDLTPFTILDYPDIPAAIIWLAGCNFRCPYCHNPDIVFGKNEKDFEEVLNFLKKRKGLLEGVVITGGEPTLNKNLEYICKSIKDLGYKIKLDSNGSNPQVIKQLLNNNLLNYAAIDFKAPKEKYINIAKVNFYNELIETLKLLNNSKIEFEVRTTVHTKFLNEKDIEKIFKLLENLNFKGKYYIQNYIKIGKTLEELPDQERILEINKLKFNLNVGFRNF